MSCFEERNTLHTSSKVTRASYGDSFEKIIQKFIFVEFKEIR